MMLLLKWSVSLAPTCNSIEATLWKGVSSFVGPHGFANLGIRDRNAGVHDLSQFESAMGFCSFGERRRRA